MADDIGVLELSIQDDSNYAASGLGKLETKLKNLKTAAEGFNLSPVASQIKEIVGAVKGSEKVVASLGTFLNAVSKYQETFKNLGEKFKIDVRPIKQLKSAIKSDGGFKIGNLGSQMEQLRASLSKEWNTENVEKIAAVVNSLANAAKGNGIADVKKAMAEAEKMAHLSDAKNRQKEWFEAGGFATGKRMPLDLQFFGGKKGSSKSDGQIQMDLDNLFKTTQEVIQQNTEHFENVGSDIAEKIAVGLEKSKDRVLQGTGVLADTIKQGIYSNMNLKSFASSPVESIYDQVKHSTKAIEIYQSSIGATMQTQESMDAKTKLMADHIKETTKHIQNLLNYLDATPNPKGKGFDSIVNAITGVTNHGKESLINENTTMFKPIEDDVPAAMESVQKATSGVVSVFNSATGAYENVIVETQKIKDETNEASQAIEGATMKVENLINLETMKASGKNGVFANAADEANYLTAKIDEAKQAQQQFNDIAANAEKQLKYGGPISKDELTFNLQHATEGYYEAVQAEEKYKAALGDLLAYARETAASVKQVTDAATELPATNAIKELDEATKEASSGGMEEFRREIQEIANSTEPVISKIELLQNKLNHLWGRVAELSETPAVDAFGADTGRDNAINNYMLQITHVYDQLEKLISKSHEAQEAMQFEGLKDAADNLQRAYGSEMVEDLVKNYTEIDLLNIKLQGLKQALADDINQNKVDTQQIAMRTIAIKELEEKIKSLKDTQEDASRITKKFGSAFHSFIDGISKMFPSITNLIKRFKSTVISRSLRYVIREIASGFSEGVKNVYQYSKAVGTDLAPAMDQAATALQQMKNSIGAAVAPVIQALVPVLQNVVNWFINLVNYANQFFALLNGQNTWTRALPESAEAYEKSAKNAKAASKATKDLLADWDELNIIQSNSGGGAGSGAGKAAEDYKNMFEEVGEFSEEVKGVVSWIQDHMDMIKNVAAAIGVAILGWKLSKAFNKGLSTLSSLLLEATGIVVGLMFTQQGAYNAGLEGGFDLTTGLATAGGILTTTISSALIGFKIAGPWGALIGGAAGLVLSIGTAISAYLDGDRTRKQLAKWGKLHLTDEQIGELVDQQVTAPVLVELEAMVDSIQNREDARKAANAQISSFGTDLDAAKFALSTDTEETSTNVQNALHSAKEAIKTIQAALLADREGLKLSFTKFTYKDKEGNDVTKDLYSNLLEGNLALDQFFTDMGKDIARYISNGFGEGLTEEEMTMAMNLMDSLNNIVSTAENNYQAKKVVRDSEREMNQIYDIETAQKVLDKQQERLSQYRDTTEKLMKEDLDSYYKNIEYYEGIKQYYLGKNDKTNADRYAKFIEDTQLAIQNTEEWLKQIQDGTYWKTNKTYTGMQDRMAQMWMDKFSNWYAEDFYNSLFGNAENPFENNIVASNILHTYGITPYSMLTEDQIAKYVQYVVDKNLGDQGKALEEIKKNNPGLIDESMVSKYLPRANTPSSTVHTAIWDMLLTGASKNSGTWNSMLDSNRKIYGSEFNSVYENIIGGMEELYNQMIKDMFSGFTREQMEKKYINNIDLAELFMNTFPDRFGDPKAIDPKYVRFLELVEDIDLDELEAQKTGRIPKGLGVIGGMGMTTFARGSGTSYVTPNNYGTSEPMTEQQLASGVATGVQKGSEDQNSILRNLAWSVQRILNKEWTVNVIPGSDWGRHNSKSNESYSKQTGEDSVIG